MTLRQARILSSETDSNISQTQTTNVNIKVNQPKPKPDTTQQSTQPPAYPMGGISANVSYPNFTTLQSSMTAATDPSQYPSVRPTTNDSADTDIDELKHQLMIKDQECSDLAEECDNLEHKNKFLELLLSAYQLNPLRINKVVVVNHRTLIEMIKLLCMADKVELVVDDSLSVNCGCCADADHDELIYISKILITRNNKTTELKYGYNNVYAEFIKFGISLKICAQ